MCVDRLIRFEYATCGRENFESGKKKLRIQNYRDTCGRGLNFGVFSSIFGNLLSVLFGLES